MGVVRTVLPFTLAATEEIVTAQGGLALEDLRVLRKDEGLRTLLDLDAMPSSDATGYAHKMKENRWPSP